MEAKFEGRLFDAEDDELFTEVLEIENEKLRAVDDSVFTQRGSRYRTEYNYYGRLILVRVKSTKKKSSETRGL